MRAQSTRRTRLIVLTLMFFALFASYSFNSFHVVGTHYFYDFERQPEALVIGRLVKAQADGVWSDGGFTGVNHYKTSEEVEPHPVRQSFQHDLYLLEKEAPPYFNPYLSQTGGQGIVFASFSNISPFSNYTNLKILRTINCLLIAFVFVIFLNWAWKHFCPTPAIIAFVLLLSSTWITYFAHNLWWVLWSFYLPFVAMLAFLERRYYNPKKSTFRLLYLIAFSTSFLKCFFSGFEFISSALVAGMCPLIFYLILRKTKLKSAIEVFLKTSLAMVAGVLAEMLILILQLKSYFGSFDQAFEYIGYTFLRRAKSTEGEGVTDVLYTYLKGNVYANGFINENHFSIYFGVFVLIIILCGYIIIHRDGKRTSETVDKNKALVYTTFISFLAPLSWFIIFKGHAAIHPHLDYIVWFMPSFLFGFILIGKTLVRPRKESFCHNTYVKKNHKN